MKIAASIRTRERQEALGQFLTAAPVANLMASLFGPLPRTVRLLDAGAGAGALTKAFATRCCKLRGNVRTIEATLYELDGAILPALTATLRECEQLCTSEGIRFTFTVHSADFIQEMSARLSDGLFGSVAPTFDAAIVNPPYRKISAASAARHALRSIGIEANNLKGDAPRGIDTSRLREDIV